MRKFYAIAIGAMLATSALADDDERQLFVGVDQVDAVFSVSTPSTIFTGSNTANFNSSRKTDATFNRLRLGMQLSESVGVEAHYGLEDSSANSAENTAAVESYYGLFLLPQGKIFTYIDVELPIGFAKVEIRDPDLGLADVDGFAYGLNLGVALSTFSENEDRGWDARLLGGGMVYQQDSNSRFYGYNLGLRIDF